MVGLVIGTAVVALLGLAASRYGADTRGGREWARWQPRAESGYRRAHLVRGDLRSVHRALGRARRAVVVGHRLTAASHGAPLPARWVGPARHLHWVRGADGWRLSGGSIDVADAASTTDPGTARPRVDKT